MYLIMDDYYHDEDFECDDDVDVVVTSSTWVFACA